MVHNTNWLSYKKRIVHRETSLDKVDDLIDNLPETDAN